MARIVTVSLLLDVSSEAEALDATASLLQMPQHGPNARPLVDYAIHTDAIAPLEVTDAIAEGAYENGSAFDRGCFLPSGVFRGHLESLACLSTAHLNEEALLWLLSGAGSAMTYPNEYGWFMHIPSDPGDLDGDVPASVLELMACARENHIVWLKFDRDAESVPGLPTYDVPVVDARPQLHCAIVDQARAYGAPAALR